MAHSHHIVTIDVTINLFLHFGDIVLNFQRRLMKIAPRYDVVAIKIDLSWCPEISVATRSETCARTRLRTPSAAEVVEEHPWLALLVHELCLAGCIVPRTSELCCLLAEPTIGAP